MVRSSLSTQTGDGLKRLAGFEKPSLPSARNAGLIYQKGRCASSLLSRSESGRHLILASADTILYNVQVSQPVRDLDSKGHFVRAVTLLAMSKENQMRHLLCLILCFSLLACQAQTEEKPVAVSPEKAQSQPTGAAAAPAEGNSETAPVPPAPPLKEDFQGRPQMSLFPRVGAYRPELADEQELQIWSTFIDHLVRTSGPLKPGGEDDPNIAFSFRAIKGIDSIGYFSPIAVEPGTEYRVSADLTTDLAEGASAGIGILEFNEFKWIGEQYPESLATVTQTGTQQLAKLTGQHTGEHLSTNVTTGRQTRMIHLLFFRDGTHDRNPVIIDNLEITPVASN